MTSQTPRMRLPLMAAAQAQKHVTHNEALYDLDAYLGAYLLSRDLATPPESPSDGDAYLIAADADGAWSGKDSQIAYSADGGWRFLTAFPGLIMLLADENKFIVFDGVAWLDYASFIPLSGIPQLGVNTAPDASNKFAVKSNAVLFAALEESASGSGDLRFTVNKESPSHTSSLLFQSNWSGRAEFGLCGDDDLHLKVSPDASSWLTAIRIDKSTGLATLTGDPTADLHAATKQYVDSQVASGGGGGGDGAPIAASYLTLATHAGLSAERVLTAGTGIAFTDAGANATLTINNNDPGSSAISDHESAADPHPQYFSSPGALAVKDTISTGDITNAAVTYGKIQNISATDRLLGRATSGAGVLEEITCTAAARALLDDPSSSAMLTTLGLDNTKIAALTFTIDGGGDVLTTGIKGDLLIPFACTITSATLLADQSGAAVLDIWKDSYGNFPPLVGDTITASAKPTLSSALKAQDTSLTGWTTAITAGDTLRFNIDSVSAITRLSLILKVIKT